MTRGFDLRACLAVVAFAVTGGATPLRAQIGWLPCAQTDSTCAAPQVPREFRGVWVASVRNLDWPSKPGLPPSLAKAELVALLDRAAVTGLNAVLLQVRPAGDALYESKIEPWSEYLTGKQGLPPVPLWDPLAFAVAEAHKRGLELHAWFNPYRAREPSAKGPLASTHIARKHPELVKKYGTQLWMDPGEPLVREQTMKVVLDVVKRYDIDGVHIDDYFYPYPERRRNGSTDFPDERSWAAYKKHGGTLARDDWRRSNVDGLIEELHREIAKLKPWVKFGISPFQLWRPGNPASITTGLDAYATLYADSKKWFNEGWVDYLSPQLYRRVDEERSYGVLMRWWAGENLRRRHLWPGLYTSGVRTGNATEWRANELVQQVTATRAMDGVTGNVHFSMEAFLTNRDSIATIFQRGVYATPALVPASPWMRDAKPEAPLLSVNADASTLTIRNVAVTQPRWWLVQVHADSGWQATITDGAARTTVLPAGADRVVVAAISRTGEASVPAALRVP